MGPRHVSHYLANVLIGIIRKQGEGDAKVRIEQISDALKGRREKNGAGDEA